MLVVFATAQGAEGASRVEARLASRRLAFTRIDGRPGHVVFLVRNAGPEDRRSMMTWPEVEDTTEVEGTHHLVTRDFLRADTEVAFGDVVIGGGRPVVLAGPCGVESRTQLMDAAEAVARCGVHGLRGGAFKPRTSPYGFQGLGRAGLDLLREARDRFALPIVTEVMSTEDVDAVAEVADMVQIGTRSMQNFRLLEAVGRCGRPVLLKRGMMATLEEFLAAAEYVYLRGNGDIVLCERGIRTFEPRLRNTLDLGGVAWLKRRSHLPVVVDPSHGCGQADIVPDLARAGLAVGADGLLIEVHARPDEALSDGAQSLLPAQLADLMADLDRLARALGRPLAPAGVRAAEHGERA